jgi:hypothetical protein
MMPLSSLLMQILVTSLEMMAQKLGNISDTTIGQNMNKIGYTRKKRRMDIVNAAKKRDHST